MTLTGYKCYNVPAMTQNHLPQGDYPIGTITYYGPDDQTVTKIVAGFFASRHAQPVLRKWHGPDVITDPKVIAQIGAFFVENQVQRVVMSEGVIGCPHEEGVDYPVGESCPHCPFWQDK